MKTNIFERFSLCALVVVAAMFTNATEYTASYGGYKWSNGAYIGYVEPGRVVVRSIVQDGWVLRMMLGRDCGSDGRIAVKAKTQTSTAMMGTNGSADFDYVKDILEWGDGDATDRSLDIPTYAQPWEGVKMLRVKLSTLTQGDYTGCVTPHLDSAKVYVPLK